MTDRKLGSFGPLIAIAVVLALASTACSGAGGGGGGSAKTITLAAVDNPQMADLKKLVSDFKSAHSDIDVKIVTLPEDQLRQQVTQGVAANSGRYDLFTIGTYEVPLWAKKGWIENLSPYIAKDSSYAVDDLIPGIRTALSYQNNLYAVPFYGESSMLMYRKDMLAAKGITMPDHPTWDQVAAAAKAVHSSSTSGICLRGLPGWGEQLAPLDTVVNTFGGRWFDQQWNAQLNTQQWKDAAWTFADWATSKAYIKLVGTKLGWAHVPPGTRTSTYALSEYQQAASGFAQVTMESIAHADVTHATVDPVPYVGIQYVDIDEIQQLGDQVSQEFAKVIAGGQTVDQALTKAQALAAAVGKKYQT